MLAHRLTMLFLYLTTERAMVEYLYSVGEIEWRTGGLGITDEYSFTCQCTEDNKR